MSEDSGKRVLVCPCGEIIRGANEDELVELVEAHLAAEHPGRSYSREEILALAL